MEHRGRCGPGFCCAPWRRCRIQGEGSPVGIGKKGDYNKQQFSTNSKNVMDFVVECAGYQWRWVPPGAAWADDGPSDITHAFEPRGLGEGVARR